MFLQDLFTPEPSPKRIRLEREEPSSTTDIFSFTDDLDAEQDCPVKCTASIGPGRPNLAPDARSSKLNADDIDASLAGLVMDFSSYDMSEALLALSAQQPVKDPGGSGVDVPVSTAAPPSVFKQEIPSPTDGDSMAHTSPYNSPHSSDGGQVDNVVTPHDTQQNSQPNRHFKYILNACTSMCTRINEESVSYLNQGQAYEIKLRKVDDVPHYNENLFKTVIRLCFHDRHLQFREQEHIYNWRQSHLGERLLELETPLSYSVFNVVQDPTRINVCEFVWDGSSEAGIYVKLNCVSTEFTPKKHGGEKGVTFRLLIETFTHNEESPLHLHSAACQVKVFKLKGAERKHKQDLEKLQRKPVVEQRTYKPSQKISIFNEVMDSYVPLQPVAAQRMSQLSTVPSTRSSSTRVSSTTSPVIAFPNMDSPHSAEEESDVGDIIPALHSPLLLSSSTIQIRDWLQQHHLSSHWSSFQNYTARDILQLTREDFIQICGAADGIRFFNTLHGRLVGPRLTLYLCSEHSSVYRAVYLHHMTLHELLGQIVELVGIQREQVVQFYFSGPFGIDVQMTDDVVRNMHNEMLLQLHIDSESRGVRLKLKKVDSDKLRK